jgi:hypothetical protein
VAVVGGEQRLEVVRDRRVVGHGAALVELVGDRGDLVVAPEPGVGAQVDAVVEAEAASGEFRAALAEGARVLAQELQAGGRAVVLLRPA